jgi:hypothetical protein
LTPHTPHTSHTSLHTLHTLSTNRVIAVLKAWIERQWYDFDTALTNTLLAFIKNQVQTKEVLKNVADQLLAIIAKKVLSSFYTLAPFYLSSLILSIPLVILALLTVI